MDYGKLNTNLKALGQNYANASGAGTSMLGMLGRTVALAGGAAIAYQKLSGAINDSIAHFRDMEKDFQGVEKGLRQQAAAVATSQQGLLKTEQAMQVKARASAEEINSLKATTTAINFEIAARNSRLTLVKRELATVKGRLASGEQGEKEQEKDRKRALKLKKEELDWEVMAQQSEGKLAATEQAIKSAQRAAKAAAADWRIEKRSRKAAVEDERAAAAAALKEYNLAVQGLKVPTVGSLLAQGGKVAALGGLISSMAALVVQSGKFNATLIAANTSLGERAKLWQGVLAAQAQTGNSLENLTELTLELRHQAQLYRGDWREVLVTASKLQVGLGASTAEIGEMLSAAQAMRVTFNALADSVSNLVSKTSLSVRDALDLTKELRTVLLSYDLPTSGAQVDASLKQLASLEVAMQRAGANRGGAQRIMQAAAENPFLQARAGTLGQPAFLGDPAKLKEVQARLEGIFEEVSRYPQIIQKQMYAARGVAGDDAVAYVRGLKMKAQIESELTQNQTKLEQRFAEQSAQANKSLGQLGQTLKALMFQVLTPLIPMVQGLNQALSWGREKLMGLSELAPSWLKLGVVLGGAALATKGLISVLGQFVLAAKTANHALQDLRNRQLGLPGRSLPLPGIPTLGPRVGPTVPIPSTPFGAWGRVRAAAAANVATTAGAPLLSSWKRALPTFAASTTVLKEAAGIGPAAAAARAAGTGFTLSGFMTSIIPVLTAALPIIIPIVLGAATIFTIGRILKSKEATQDTRTKQIEKETAEGLQRSYAIVDQKMRAAVIGGADGATAFDRRKFQAEIAKYNYEYNAKRGLDNGTGLENKIKFVEFLQSRYQMAQAKEADRQSFSSVEQVNAMRDYQMALLEALELQRIELESLRKATVQGNTARVEREKRLAQEKKQAEDKASVKAASAKPGMVPALGY